MAEETTPPPSRTPQLERRRRERGRRPGDRFVRVVRPYREEFQRTGPARYRVSEEVLRPRSTLGGLLDLLRRALIGRRLATHEESNKRVSKKTGLAIFASDNISSSAYATEEIMRVLALAGAGALALTMPITIAILVVLAIVVLSYQQTIRAYPNGGGSYIVASDNLGMLPGLVAAAALLTDYVLTVSVSIAAGVAAIGAISPFVYDNRVAVGVLAIAILTVGNLRGIRDSGNIFAAPTYLYVVSLGGLVLFGLFRLFAGTLPTVTAPAEWLPATAAPLSIFLILRAFSSGAVALTGVEAVSNGVPAFKRPEPRNAAITLILMGASFGSLFSGISVLAGHMGIVADPTEQQTVLSQVAAALVGDGWFFWVVQVATALLLLLAANTSFADFPRLSSILAKDRFAPHSFAFRGERLAFSTGILVLASLSMLLIVAFGGSVTNLIPLYTIGVFIAFTLSQSGMVQHWRRLRGLAWRYKAAMNGLGAVATGLVALIVGTTKFTSGAWMVIALIPLFVAVLYGIHRHYRRVEDALTVSDPEEARVEVLSPLVIVPVGRIDRAVSRALAVARASSPSVTAVHVTDDVTNAAYLEHRWQRLFPDIELVVLESPFRALVPPLLRYIDRLDQGEPGRPVVVVLSEFVPRHWWEVLLHNQTALGLKLRLFFRPNTIVIDVPYRAD